MWVDSIEIVVYEILRKQIVPQNIHSGIRFVSARRDTDEILRHRLKLSDTLPSPKHFVQNVEYKKIYFALF